MKCTGPILVRIAVESSIISIEKDSLFICAVFVSSILPTASEREKQSPNPNFFLSVLMQGTHHYQLVQERARREFRMFSLL